VSISDRLNRDFADWAASLTDEEVEGLRYYQGPNYKWINLVLRDPNVVLAKHQSFVVRKITALVDSAIEKGRVPFTLRVYRGMKSYEALFDDFSPSELDGFVIHDPAFVSTSVEAHRAERFMNRDEGFRLEFDVPIGHPAAWLPLVGNLQLAGQRELLLPRELEIEITDSRATDEGILQLEGRLL
jgi:ADP-ribosyltransferase exoenzyme